jgi:hypothetical protein
MIARDERVQRGFDGHLVDTFRHVEVEASALGADGAAGGVAACVGLRRSPRIALAIELEIDEAFLAELGLDEDLGNARAGDVVEQVFLAAGAGKNKAQGVASKKKRLELQERHLTPQEQDLFREAKAK